jgi:hypothetical protein
MIQAKIMINGTTDICGVNYTVEAKIRLCLPLKVKELLSLGRIKP